MKNKMTLPRRDFLRSTGVVATSILLPRQLMAALSKIKQPIKLGMIADLHQDVMHDGPARLKAFLDAMKEEKPDALLQLCLLYTSPSPRDATLSRMPSSA